MMMPVNLVRVGRALAAVAALLSAAGCASELTRTGSSPSYLIIDPLTASSGADAGKFTTQLNSDVLTLVNATINNVQTRVPTVFNDIGQATLRLSLKSPGSAATPTTPTTLNEVTITRYHVNFKRSDGHNTPGVDVPYAFDGGVTATVGATTTATFSFDIVRHSMKEEPPLKNLVNGGGAIEISTIAEITFYGRDQAGNDVSVTGLITVNFADFGDPS